VIFLIRLSLLLLCASGLFAQGTDLGSIHGVVTDPSGSAVPGSTVTIIDTATDARLTVKTSQRYLKFSDQPSSAMGG